MRFFAKKIIPNMQYDIKKLSGNVPLRIFANAGLSNKKETRKELSGVNRKKQKSHDFIRWRIYEYPHDDSYSFKR